MECDSPSRATFSFRTTCLSTMKWIRRTLALRGTISSRLRIGGTTASPPPKAIPDVGNRQGGTTFGSSPVVGAEAEEGAEAVRSASVSNWGAPTPEEPTVRSNTRVTTILVLGTGRGNSSATSSWASREERPKKRGMTTLRFSSVRTLASSPTVERQSRPSRSGSITSGKR
jgi:hypothetical protein